MQPGLNTNVMACVAESEVGLSRRRHVMESTMLTAQPAAPSGLERSPSRTPVGWYDPDSIVFQGAADERSPLLAGEPGWTLLDEGGDPLGVIGGRAGDALEPSLVLEGLVERRLVGVR
jgi:hypothetical protein